MPKCQGTPPGRTVAFVQPNRHNCDARAGSRPPLLPPPRGKAGPRLRPRVDAGALCQTWPASIAPVVFTLQLVMFFKGIRSERKLIETAILNLAHRWNVGSALDEDLPNHSSLTRIRQRLGIAIFQHFGVVSVPGLRSSARRRWW